MIIFHLKLGRNGLIDADKFVALLESSKKYSDSELSKMKEATENCRMHRHLSENKYEM